MQQITLNTAVRKVSGLYLTKGMHKTHQMHINILFHNYIYNYGINYRKIRANLQSLNFSLSFAHKP